MSASIVPSQSQYSVDSSETHSLPTLTTFLYDVPPQLTVLLAELGPYIVSIRKLAEAASWRSDYADCWLLLGTWWGICLLSEFALRYLMILIVAALYTYLSMRTPTRSRPPVTEQRLQTTIIDLSVIESLSPTLPQPHKMPLSVLARVLAILYLPSLALTYFVRLKVLLGVFGTIFFIWRARWAISAREVIWRSAWFRRGLARIWTLLSGEPFQTVVLSSSTSQQTPETDHSMRFLITIYENQRWWVGLDWTAALLPNERPSWCSVSLDPVLPPSAFTLPSPSCTFVGDGKGGLVRRTATWSWEEGEWKVSVKKESGLKRIEKELPSPKEDTTPHTNKVGRAKQKLYETGQKLKTHQDTDSKDVDEHEVNDEIAAETDSSLHDADPDAQNTDNDGWVYGDNKWKAFSSSGGLGKYTRFRKWSRVALLTELVEAASAAEAHTYAAQRRESPVRERDTKNDTSSRRSIDEGRRSLDERRSIDDDRDSSSLRKRLKAAIRKPNTNT